MRVTFGLGWVRDFVRGQSNVGADYAPRYALPIRLKDMLLRIDIVGESGSYAVLRKKLPK